MKKLLLFIFAVFYTINSSSQENASIKTAEILDRFTESKSANYKDILTNLFQLTTRNLNSDDKSIGLNTNLFALKSKANPNLFKDVNFEKERFSRNFELNIKVNLNDQFKYKGFTGGATFAIINGRDKQLALFSNNYIKPYNILIGIIAEIRDEITKDDNYDADKLETAINAIYSGKEISNNSYFDIIKTQFVLKAKPDILNSNPIEYIKTLKELEANEFTRIDSKALWTISIDGTAAEKGKFNKASVETIFLQGIKEKSEIDIRTKLIYADTLTVDPVARIEFNSKAGMNFKIAKGANNASFFEIKGAFEYSSILKNVLPIEKKNVFLATAEIRIRLANDLWFPLIVKYDIEKANFLGFLNISYNFGSFKPKG
jgi:hypothetical protein